MDGGQLDRLLVSDCADLCDLCRCGVTCLVCVLFACDGDDQLLPLHKVSDFVPVWCDVCNVFVVVPGIAGVDFVLI